MLERMQARMDEREKKMELIVATLQALTKGPPKEDGDKSHNKEILSIRGEDWGKGEEDDKKKEGEDEKDSPQHLKFTPFKNCPTLRNVGMLVKEEVVRETTTKTTNNVKSIYHNREKKDNGFISEEVHGLKYFLSKNMMNLMLIKPKMGSTWKFKNYDPNKYCKYH
ncbi:hypothetical protein Cgig2_009656 [Carnegiea gigantea]|uniref:Uncharacterized protein n=1 Tax=Carnegiea gigantea TaxID=171969 RepID=A0A9Q1QC30_9CARY|nr:hypothetical protein Cgig2_009656 [Carnegiea gigantea]